MSTTSRLSDMQLAAAVARERDGRRDTSVMTSEQRAAAGLMTLHQAAEHEGLAARVTSCTRLADRVKGMDPDDTWAGDAPSRDDEEYAAIWLAWTGAGHLDKGCFGWMQRDFLGAEVMCSCGDRLPLPQKAATA